MCFRANTNIKSLLHRRRELINRSRYILQHHVNRRYLTFKEKQMFS